MHEKTGTDELTGITKTQKKTNEGYYGNKRKDEDQPQMS
jgi:hypothetical protein